MSANMICSDGKIVIGNMNYDKMEDMMCLNTDGSM